LFVPSTARSLDTVAPLVVALHGCTQTASDFAAGTRLDSVAEGFGAYVLYPEQTVAANAQRCWNWYRAQDQARDAGEPAAILALVADVVLRFPIDRQRVYVVGLSAGGAMAAILAEQAPDVFSGAGIMAGVGLHASRTLAEARGAMRGEAGEDAEGAARENGDYGRLRLSLWAGADDRIVAPVNAARLARQFVRLLDIAGDAVLERRENADIQLWRDAEGRTRIELWSVANLGHAWSGGSFRGSFTSSTGPRASDEMLAFFLGAAER
jgi:poly(hydroxyalkanoate) depolymerase family esterase